LHQRIFGTECEYAAVYHRPSHCLVEQPCRENLLEHLKTTAARMMAAAGGLQLPMAGEFLGNGGRLYVDRGGHPEYATPECRRVTDLVAHELAGDRLVRELADRMNAGEKTIRLHVYKNNVDGHGHTYGGHENYLVSARGMKKIARLIPFLVTRQIYTGAGKIMAGPRDGGLGFQISQRADFFDCTYSDRTSEVRGIINTRKREITRMDQDQRLHLIIADSNMAQYTLGLKIGTLSLMLRLLENGALDDEVLDLASPTAALKAVSRDLHAGLSVHHHGRDAVYTALEIQSLCLEKARAFYAVHPPDPEEEQWLGIWSRVLDGLRDLKVSLPDVALEADDAGLRRRIDWVLKLWLLDRSRSKGADKRQLKSLDLKYHDLDPASGLYEHCLALDLVDRLIPDEEIAKARWEPPADTRARLRGEVVRQTFGRNLSVEVENWERLRIHARNSDREARHFFNQIKSARNCMEIRLEDPFRADDPKIMAELREFITKWS
jgi:proteasome accessory factor A